MLLLLCMCVWADARHCSPYAYRHTASLFCILSLRRSSCHVQTAFVSWKPSQDFVRIFSLKSPKLFYMMLEESNTPVSSGVTTVPGLSVPLVRHGICHGLFHVANHFFWADAALDKVITWEVICFITRIYTKGLFKVPDLVLFYSKAVMLISQRCVNLNALGGLYF